MNWSDIVQGVASLVSLGIVGWLVGWIYRLYKERERSLKERYEGKIELLEQRLKLKSEEVEKEKEASRRYKVVVDEHKEYLERQLWDIQRKAGIAPDEVLPHERLELSTELKQDIGKILSRLEQISMELPLPSEDMLLSRGSAYAATGQHEKDKSQRVDVSAGFAYLLIRVCQTSSPLVCRLFYLGYRWIEQKRWSP